MTEPLETSWQVPPFESDPNTRLGWIEEQIQEGDGGLDGQPAVKNLERNIRIYEGIFNDKSKSTLCTNYLKFNIRKFVETISDVREIGMYGSDARQFKDISEMINKVAKAIYIESQYPRQIRKALQFATVMGSGYIWPKCKAAEYGFGERRIVFEPLGILDVVPVQTPMSHDIQEAYAVTIYQYMPIAEAHGRFPLFQSQLKPVNRVSYNSRLQARRSDFAERFHYGSQERSWGDLYCEIRYTFIRDLRINNTGYELPMGDLNTSWFYKVPYLGQEIFGGVRNNEPFMRPAIKEDCRVYPYLRLMISSKGVDTPMYDGPGFDWHGMIPAVQYTFDDCPWKPGGLSLVDNVWSIEQTKRKHERKIDQILSTRMNPPIGYDRTSTGGPKIENFDLFEENVRAGVDGKPKDIIQSLLPDEVDVQEKNFKFLEILGHMEEQQLGINDLGSLTNMKLNISSDSFDKALESVGPIAKGMAGSMEASNAKVAYMLKFMIIQWLDTARIMEYIGADNITQEIIDFDPESMVPSHMADEYGPLNTLPGTEQPDGSFLVQPSRYEKIDRGRRFAKNVRLVSVPSTLLKITQLQEQTKYMALYGRGAPISFHTVAKKLGIENYGEIEGNTEFQKWINEQKVMLLLKAEAAHLAAELGLTEEPKQQGKQHAGGRPPSDKKEPKAVMKDKSSNPRPVMKTSA